MPPGHGSGVSNTSSAGPAHSRDAQIELWDSRISHGIGIDSSGPRRRNHAAANLRGTCRRKELVKMCGADAAGDLPTGKARRMSRAEPGAAGAAFGAAAGAADGFLAGAPQADDWPADSQ